VRVFRRGTESGIPQLDQDEATGFEDRVSAIGSNDVAGLDGVIEELGDVVGTWPISARYEALQANPPNAILRSGESGCGKTLLGARCGHAADRFYRGCGTLGRYGIA
jgi:ATP-dependent 26S proteasome regulatory subunit